MKLGLAHRYTVGAVLYVRNYKGSELRSQLPSACGRLNAQMPKVSFTSDTETHSPLMSWGGQRYSLTVTSTASPSENVNGMRLQLSLLVTTEEKVDGSLQLLCFTRESSDWDARILARLQKCFFFGFFYMTTWKPVQLHLICINFSRRDPEIE